jgi:hypothetical protein
MVQIGSLSNADEGFVLTAPFFLHDVKLWHALTTISQLQALLGADGCTAAAELTTIFPVINNPGEIVVR